MKTEELFVVEPIERPRSACDEKGGSSETADKACSLDDEMQDLYGRSHYGLSSSRPTMISAKYRQKEERRKVLKLSMNKLKRIEDPESSLRRSVLINNTVKRLQREAREEKSQKSALTGSYTQSKCFGIGNDFLATTKQVENLKSSSDVFASPLSSRTADQLLDITNLRDTSKTSGVAKCDSDCLDCDEAISDLTFPTSDRSLHQKASRKRSIDEALDEECDVLSQFYLPPPTPRILPALDEDEDEDVNVVDIDTPAAAPPAKKCRKDDSTCCLTAADRLRDDMPVTSTPTPSSSPLAVVPTTCLSASLTVPNTFLTSCSSTTSSFDDWAMDDSILLQTASLQSAHTTPSSSPFSCGHSSMMNEIVVYHNLIASFES